MTNTPFTHISQLKDTHAVRQYDTAIIFGIPEKQANAFVCEHARDRCRTPVQWKNAPNAGFSPEGVVTWLHFNHNYADVVNVADQQENPDSLLNFYKQMLRIRKKTPALITGTYTPLLEQNKACCCFLRSTGTQTCLVVLNFSSIPQILTFDGLHGNDLIFSSVKNRGPGRLNTLKLSPFEIYIAEVK